MTDPHVELHQLATALDELDCSDPDEVAELVDQVADRLREMAGEWQAVELERERAIAHGPLVPPPGEDGP